MEKLGKDLRGYVGQMLEEKDFLNYCRASRDICHDDTYRLYLFNKYPSTIQDFIHDKERLSEAQLRNVSWKEYFLLFIYYKSILNNVFSEKDQKEASKFFGVKSSLTDRNGDTVSRMKEKIDQLLSFKGGAETLLLSKSIQGNLEGVKFAVSRIKKIRDNSFLDISISAAKNKGFTDVVNYLEEFIK